MRRDQTPYHIWRTSSNTLRGHWDFNIWPNDLHLVFFSMPTPTNSEWRGPNKINSRDDIKHASPHKATVLDFIISLYFERKPSVMHVKVENPCYSLHFDPLSIILDLTGSELLTFRGLYGVSHCIRLPNFKPIRKCAAQLLMTKANFFRRFFWVFKNWDWCSQRSVNRSAQNWERT